MIKGSEWNGGKKYKESFVEVKKEVKESKYKCWGVVKRPWRELNKTFRRSKTNSGEK